MALDKATVSNIARLARIRATDQELEAMTAELSHIMTWIERLNEVDTADVPPMTGISDMTLPRRADAVNDGDCRDAVLGNAPRTEDGFFVVPKVVE